MIRLAVHLAHDWLDLQRRLRAAGFALRRAPDGGLAVHCWPLDHPVMDIGKLGFSLAGLVLKFRAPFPGDLRHRHRERPTVSRPVSRRSGDAA
ncbi:MAG: hypothetical protein B7Z02_03635 [Rhodobacterales bacterium 32-67-9]|nr:MAG: hypothetical protein B7Z02_03635 [Rhodobacterales bacterium 32-67-9]